MDLSSLFKRVNVDVGEACDISEFCSLENVALGNHVNIRAEVQLKNVVIESHTTIGRRVSLYSAQPARPVRIGKQCWLSYGVFGEATGDEIRIADHVVIAHSTTMLTSSGPGRHSSVMSALYPTQLGPIRVGAHAWIGAHCVLLPGAELEEGVVLGANSVAFAGRYESWSVYGGTPARPIKKLDIQAVAAAKDAPPLET